MKYLVLLLLLAGCSNPLQLEGKCFINYMDDNGYKILLCNLTYCQVQALYSTDRPVIIHRRTVEDQLIISCPAE